MNNILNNDLRQKIKINQEAQERKEAWIEIIRSAFLYLKGEKITEKQAKKIQEES